MRRLISQLLILVVFTVLTIVASLDSGQDKNSDVEAAEQATVKTWSAASAKIVEQFSRDLFGLQWASPDDVVAENPDNQVGTPWFADGHDMVEVANEEVNDKSAFRVFIKDLFKKLPSRYLDTKIYSNVWHNFASFYDSAIR